MDRALEILVIEDDVLDYRYTSRQLRDRVVSRLFKGTPNLTWRASLADGLEAISSLYFDVILLDLSLPDTLGIDGVSAVREAAPQIPIVVLTGHGESEVAVAAVSQGVQDYVVKGANAEVLGRAILYALERQKVLSRLKAAEQEALAAVEAKSRFLATMSHEIRTPLTAILGYTDILADPQSDKQQSSRALSSIKRNGEHLLTVVNNILNFAKLEAGNEAVELSSCSPSQIVHEIEDAYRLRAEEKGIELRVTTTYPVPSAVMTDAACLQLVLTNLVGNGIKFTEEGSVEIAMSFDPSAEELIIRVIDTGIGIPVESQERIFAAFTQADSSMTRTFGGSGLGLAIAREAAERIGGSLQLESEKGKGAVFTFSLPTGPVVEMAYGPVESPAASIAEPGVELRGSVLLVEDGADNRNVLRYILEKAGLTVETAENGKIAVDLVNAQPFDLVLMDMAMPVMDGYTAARTIRQQGLELPIIGLSADSGPAYENRCREAGCNGAISKPFRAGELFSVLQAYLETAPIEAPPALEEDLGEDFDEDDLDEPLIPEVFRQDPAYQQIVSDFRSSLSERVQELRRARTTNNFDELALLAHRLKTAELFGYPSLGRAAARLEQAAKDGEVTQIQTLLQQLSSLTEKIAPRSFGDKQ